jgi:hypothetical protein
MSDARPSPPALRAVHGAFAALFLFGAAVQYNDPDPLRWIAIYFAAAVTAALAALDRARWPLAAAVGAIALVWAAVLAPRGIGAVAPRELVAAWEMKDECVEVGREDYGLLIIAVWMAVIAVLDWRRRRRVTQ